MKAGYKLRSVWFQGLAALGTARPPPWRHEAGMKGLFPALWLVSPKGPRNQTSFPPAPDASPRLLFPTGALERPRPQRAYAFFSLEEVWINCSLVASKLFLFLSRGNHNPNPSVVSAPKAAWETGPKQSALPPTRSPLSENSDLNGILRRICVPAPSPLSN